MFIESWQIVLVAVWIVYLLYRTSVWNGRVQEISNQYEQLLRLCSRRKARRTKDLLYIILKYNQDVLKKAPKKLRDKVLNDEAERILRTIYYCNTDKYDNVSWIEIDELFGAYAELLPPSDDDTRDRINLDSTKPHLVKRLEELMDEDISYLED